MGNRAARFVLVSLLALVAGGKAFAAGPIPPSGCPTCIQNTATPQTAQINIGTATIRGTLTASTGTFTNLVITNLNVTSISGNGSGLTNLNASHLASGTVPLARLSGSYTGITGVGTITAGTWNGTNIGTQYGGTGQNWAAVGTGALPYFSAAGTMSTLAAGASNRLLQANGAGAPSWTAAPTVLGTNITAIPLANLQSGNLPQTIAINDSSISTVTATKVIGNISGNAAGITGTLALNKLEAGTLNVNVVASSITGTGVSPGTYGGAATAVQAVVRSDGRLSSISQTPIAINTTQINAGALPAGVTLPASQVSNGNLGAGVVAQTLNASGVSAATYGSPTFVPQIAINAEGRITSATNVAIPAVSTSAAWQDRSNVWTKANTAVSGSSWTFRDNVLVTGTLSLSNALGVASGGTGRATLTEGTIPYGNGTSAIGLLPVMGNGGLVIGTGGLAPSTGTLTGTANQVTVTRVAAGLVLSGPQDLGTGSSPTFAALTLSSPLTVPNGGSGVTSLTANGVVVGNGSGALFALPAMGAGGIITGSDTGARPSTGTLTGTANRVTVTQTGSNIVLSGPQDLGTGSSPTFAALTLTAPLTPANGGTGQDWSGVTAGRIPYFTGTGALGTLATSVNGYVLTQAGGVPTWAASASSATHLAGGGVGQIPYQSAANATAFLPAMGAAGIVVGNGTSVAPSTATLTGTANQVTVTQTATAITLSLPQNINSGAAPTFLGTNFTGVPQSGVTNLVSDLALKASTGTNADITNLNSTQRINVSTLAATSDLNIYVAGGVRVLWCGGTSCTSISSFTANGNIEAIGNLLADQDIIADDDLQAFDDLKVEDDGYVASQLTVGQGSNTSCSSCTLHVVGGAAITGTMQSNAIIIPAGGLADGVIYGQDIALSTIPVHALNKTGASDGYAIVWSDANNRWQPGPVGTDVGASTVTYLPNGLTGHPSTQNPNVCTSPSTATVTCNTQCRLMATYQTSHQAGAGNLYVNLLFDGAFAPFIATGSNTAPCATWDNGSSTAGLTCSILGPVMSAGVHNVCVAIGLSSGGANPSRAGQLSVVPVK